MNQRNLFASATFATLLAIAGLGTASAADLVKVDKQNAKAQFTQSDRPIIILSCADSCGTNEVALAAQATKHPEVKWVKVSAAEFNADVGLIVFVPGAGVTFQQNGFDASKVDEAFYTKRTEFALKEAAAAKDVKAAKAKLDEAVKGPKADLAKAKEALEDIVLKDKATSTN